MKVSSFLFLVDFSEGLLAVEHAMIAMSPIFALYDRGDISGYQHLLSGYERDHHFHLKMDLKEE